MLKESNMKKIIFTALVGIGMVFTANAQALKVASDGNVGIGTANPARPLEVVGQIMASNVNTYPANKQSNFLMRHYDNTNTHFAYFNAQSDNANNQVLFGGGAGSQYAATVVAFMTGANRTTLLGTEGMRVNNQQRVRISKTGGAVTHDLTLYGTAAKTGGGSWDVPSDRRIKTDVSPFTDGLSELMKIKPVNFKYIPEFDPKGEPQVGVIAQDMMEIAPYMVREVELNYESDEKESRKARGLKSIYTYNESALTYILVNAVQQQQEEIEAKDQKLQELTLQVEEIQKQLSSLLDAVDGLNSGGVKIGVIKSQVEIKGQDLASLSQNRPNPFNGLTVIDYEVPTTAKQAQLNFYTPTGQLVKTVNVDHIGVGEITFKASDVPAGTYSYSLVVDGVQVATKQMILSN
jgi:hypothetical protein